MSALRDTPTVDALTREQVLRMMRGLAPELVVEVYQDLMRDTAWKDTPMGQEALAYLRVKRKSISERSYADWEVTMSRFATHFPYLTFADFEPPMGTERIEEFLSHYWSKSKPTTYNKNLSITADFFKFSRLRGKMIANPCEIIAKARTQQVYRETFSEEQCEAIIASSPLLRDRIALRLLLFYAIRKGALAAIQFKHFDHQRRRLTIFTKGGKVRAIPLPEPELWLELERHILDVGAQPDHYLMCPHKKIPRVGVKTYPDRPLAGSAMHRWWYQRLAAAGIVDKGTNSGEKMHKARHTAGQRVLDHTGNLKVVQKLLGHASISTTADVYVDWDDDALRISMAAIVNRADREDEAE